MIYQSLLNRKHATESFQGEWKVHSPHATDTSLGVCRYRYAEIDLAVKGAHDFAIPASIDERLTLLPDLSKVLSQAQTKLFQIAQQELGRSADELEQEWRLTLQFLNQTPASLRKELENTEARGVSVFLASYVWPIYYAVQFAVSNFLAGNPLIIKPSEKSTATTLGLVEALRELEAFKCIQVLVGEREVGRRLATHEGVATIQFQGSFEFGMRVKQDALSQVSKEVLLYLGSKNPAIVFEDAAVDTEAKLIGDAFQGAGQHCRSISVIFVQRSRHESFVSKFHELSKTFTIGAPDAKAFMGPLIDSAMVDRYLKFIGISEREGGVIEMRGKLLPSAGKGNFVTPTLVSFNGITADQVRKSVSLQTEILSPHVSVIAFENDAELKEILRAMSHGRLASVWSANVERAKNFANDLQVGEVVINQSVFEFRPWQTVQARKRSGNHAALGEGLLRQLVFQKTIHS